jgi:hypothetical protein
MLFVVGANQAPSETHFASDICDVPSASRRCLADRYWESLECKNYCFVVKCVRISRVNLVSSHLRRLHVVISIPQLSKLDVLRQAVRIRVFCFSVIVSINIMYWYRCLQKYMVSLSLEI